MISVIIEPKRHIISICIKVSVQNCGLMRSSIKNVSSRLGYYFAGSIGNYFIMISTESAGFIQLHSEKRQ